MNIFSVFAFLIPFPLFFDLSSRSLLIHPVVFNTILMLRAGISVPIGLLGLALVIVCSLPRAGWRLRADRNVLIALCGLAVFCFIELHRVTPVRLLSLATPVLLLLASTGVVSQRGIVDKIARGYLAGMLVQVFLHVASMCFYSPGKESLIASTRCFFGYEIYQALLSYAAVLSALETALIVYAFSPRHRPQRPRALVLAGILFAMIAIMNRKAALADEILLFLISAFLTARSAGSRKIEAIRERFAANALMFAVVALSPCIFIFFSKREISVDFVFEQRAGIYELFWASLPHLSWAEILTGKTPGWGGTSNFVLELVMRSGLIGAAAYLCGLAAALKRFYRALLVRAEEAEPALRGDLPVKMWFAFALASLTVANLVNMDIQLPYYSTNVLMINVCFVFYYFRSPSNGKRPEELIYNHA
jgi:hypothetical protein